MSTRTNGLAVRVVDTVAQVPPDGWAALVGPEELYAGIAWMRMLEATSGTSMHYLLAYDGAELVAGLPTARAHATAPWRSGRPDALLERCVSERRLGAADVRARLPEDLTATVLPGLVCGGRYLGRNRLPARDAVAVAELVGVAEGLARGERLRSISFLYVDEHDQPLRGVLEERGYHRYVSAQYHVLPVPPDGYPGYLRGFSGHRRRRIDTDRRRLREAGAQVGIEPLTGDVVPRLAELESELLSRYGFPWTPALSEPIFARIHADFGDSALLSTVRLGGRLTGFALIVPRGRTWYAHRAGFDYAANGPLPVYFDVTYNNPVEHAAAHGVTAIHYGTGSDATKESRGCATTVQYAFTRVLGTAP